ncbi:MAG: c-type cytochrome [Arcobacter sp.]|uniref:c-type cytochrome n=1 Tax=Arcobacter sp. TaxID=1872629 RepID=UPI002A74A3E6|nr:c-type cytochrome [Arcobacter sp.]MDY3205110.1 c-type cytochrome [Arcobacter sp.]
MKKVILSSILLLSSTSIFAETTMCFKENASMSTIEKTPLDGGVCNGKFSVNDMKAKGWSIEDIKISQSSTGMNFIYILKNGVTVSAPTQSSQFVGNQAQMEANILAKLEAKKEAEEKAKVEKELKDAAVIAKELYTNKCQTCHGTKGEVSAYNTARPLKDLSVEDMQESIKNYKVGKVDSMNANIMAPYANFIDYKEIKGIHAYLQSINK